MDGGLFDDDEIIIQKPLVIQKGHPESVDWKTFPDTGSAWIDADRRMYYGTRRSGLFYCSKHPEGTDQFYGFSAHPWALPLKPDHWDRWYGPKWTREEWLAWTSSNKE